MTVALRSLMILGGLAFGLSACSGTMYDQPRHEPLEESAFFADGRSARPPVPGTVARGQLREDEHFYTGMTGGRAAETFPFPIARKTLERGRERFNIHCAVCHGVEGSGDGVVPKRGFPSPPTFHSDALRAKAPGHFFNVMTNGSGRMADYAAEVSPEDRWAIAAYIQALQFSRHAPVDRLEPRDFRALNAVKTPAPSRRPPATGPTKTDSPREEGQTR